jgi:hypothetical protein
LGVLPSTRWRAAATPFLRPCDFIGFYLERDSQLRHAPFVVKKQMPAGPRLGLPCFSGFSGQAARLGGGPKIPALKSRVRRWGWQVREGVMGVQKTGRLAILQQLLADGVQYMFGNPGTVEQGFLDALSDFHDIEHILTLQNPGAMMIHDLTSGSGATSARAAWVERMFDDGYP